ncbi:hypothetical protein HU720_05385 [Pseudomonas sp. SWRI51]|uniref:hypothetical protein n=1 Tax=Pseudomonas sp. SWRI51 TaxID=2745491 RepID=UPI001648ABCE|nr:hypothetical protein [Pseudomonas sp. SWRI51]MBC3410730.1 hypothetical protein [Pseudomonas sp. SWRI51]
MYQQQYWTEMQELRAHAYYLELYQQRSERIDTGVGIFLALTSSASIAAWAMWKDASMVWGSIIAVSQVVSVAYKLLPFKTRIKPLSVASIELFSLADEAERGWHDVAEEVLTAKEINEKRFQVRSKKSAIMKSSFASTSLPEAADLMLQAESKMRYYFNNFYVGADDE